MFRESITHTRLKEIASHDDETGIFFSRVQRGKIKVGRPLGRINADGYYVIGIDNTVYLGHRLVIFYHTGVWPAGLVDHRDGDPTNNRTWNLRVATPAQNDANCGRYINNRSGFKGVTVDSRTGSFRAYIRSAGDHKYLGTFDTADAASAAYEAAAVDVHGSFYRKSV